MPIKQIFVERLSLTSDKSFESVLGATRDGVGHPDEWQGKVQLSYNRMASLLSSYNSPEVSKIAEALDSKIEALMRTAV